LNPPPEADIQEKHFCREEREEKKKKYCPQMNANTRK